MDRFFDYPRGKIHFLIEILLLCTSAHSKVMNTLLTLTCDTCEQDTDCRVGFSNRKIQPLQFACKNCETLIGITLTLGEKAPEYFLEFKNAKPISERQIRPFDGTNSFVDLHLDFPVIFGKYVMGLTPFLAAMARIRKLGGNEEAAFRLYARFNQSLDQLNYFSDRSDQVRSIIKLYFGKNKQLFKKRVSDLINQDHGPSIKPEDVNVSLYSFVSAMFMPFIDFASTADFVDESSHMIAFLGQKNGESMKNFLGYLESTKFLFNIQRDSLNLYPEIYESEMALRPALYLDAIQGGDDAMVAGAISIDRFQDYKDLYKDLCEVLGRQLVLVAGINNIIHRGGHDAFAPSTHGAALSSLDKFADKTLSEKFKYLDECWFKFDGGVINSNIRNAIAHHVHSYDEISQIITYFPEKEGVRQEKAHTMSFLAFMRLILQIFREIHYLHHVIKALLYYKILILDKNEK